MKTRTVELGPPVCAYCGEGFGGAYLHRRNADWHSGCWLQMSNDKDELAEVIEVAMCARNLAASIYTFCYEDGGEWQASGRGERLRLLAVAIERWQPIAEAERRSALGWPPLQTELQTAERITTDDTCIK